MVKFTFEARYGAAHLLVTNAVQHPVVKRKMEEYGFNADKVQQGANLLKAVEDWQMAKENNYSTKKSLKKKLDKDIETLTILYNDHLSIARFSFRNDTYMTSQLKLNGARKKDWAGWSQQVYSFYVRVEQEGLPLMKKHGAVADELARGKAMAETLIAIHTQRKSNKGDAQSSTQKRNQALKDLNHWVSNYKKVARVALQDDPQLLEVLGIVVPSAQ